MQQDVFPRSSVTTKLPCYRAPVGPPLSEAECEAYRRLAVQAVFSVWNRERRPADLAEIYHIIQTKVITAVRTGEWAYSQYARCKRTVDRRVNEAASPDYYADNLARIVCVSPGIYEPNPALFKER